MSPSKLSDLFEYIQQNKSLQDVLPELYQLKDVTENQSWHTHQTVLDHSVRTLKGLDMILASHLPSTVRSYANAYLATSLDSYNRGELLRLAALLHDIGKVVALQHNPAGETSSPSHGLIGSWVARPIVERLDLTVHEQKFVLDLIAEHLVSSDLIEMAINNGTPSQAVTELLLEHRSDTAVELLLLAYADWVGCDIIPELEAIRDRRITIANECLVAIEQKRS